MNTKWALYSVGVATFLHATAALAGPPAPGMRRTVEVGPLWNDREARNRCSGACRAPESWTGGWWTTVPDRMAVCECVAPLPTGAPIHVTPAPVPPQPQVQGAKRPVEAGPIWSNEHAQSTCPQVCRPPESWNGQWWTTVQGVMSVCECVSPMGAPPPVQTQVVYVQAPPPAVVAPPPAPPARQAMDDRVFSAFLQHLKDAAFKDAQLAAIGDEVRAGSLWNTRQLITVMQLLTFGDAQVKGAAHMWPNIVDPQNLPDVIASLTFESDRKKLRQALGR